MKHERITKLDASRRQLVTAIRLFFEDRDPVSVNTLAHNAREVLDQLCEKRAVHRFLDIMLDANPALSGKENTG